MARNQKKYIFYLNKYLEYLDCYDADILLQKSARLIESELIEFIIKLRDQNKNIMPFKITSLRLYLFSR